MEFFPPVVFEVKAKATEAIASFGALNKQLELVEKNGVLASGSMMRMEAAARAARTMILGFAGAFAVLGVVSLETLDRVEKAQANLSTAVNNTGVDFKAAKPVIDAQADSMRNLGFSMEETYAALAKMTAATGSPQTALNSLAVAADLARAKGMSLAEAGSLIAKASVGAARGLADLGLKVGVTIPKGANLATILKLIEDRVGGAAKAFGDTLGGKIAIARANFQQLEVTIGTELLPYAIKFTDWITKTAIPKVGEFTTFLKDHKGEIEAFAAVIAGIWAVNKIAAGVSAAVTAIKVLIGVYNALKVAAGAAFIAEAMASGGVAVATGVAAAAAAAAALYGVSKLAESQGGGGTLVVPQPFSQPMSVAGQTYVPPNLTGKGVAKITPTPKPSPTTTVQQNVTVYASNTNDINKKLSKAAKNGIPIGSKP